MANLSQLGIPNPIYGILSPLRRCNETDEEHYIRCKDVYLTTLKEKQIRKIFPLTVS